MNSTHPKELHVSIDVGCYQHSIAIGLANGQYLGSFDIDHNKRDRHNKKTAGDCVRLLAEQGIDHMASVELTDRQHIQAGNQQANPTGNEVRIELPNPNGHVRCQIGPQIAYHPLDQQGVVKCDVAGRQTMHLKSHDTDPHDGHGNNETRQGARQAKIEEFLAIGL